MRHKSAILDVLHQQKYMVLVFKMRIQFGNVGAVIGESVMDAQFLNELIDHVILDDGRLEYLLQCEDEACCLVFADVDIPELTRAHAFA